MSCFLRSTFLEQLFRVTVKNNCGWSAVFKIFDNTYFSLFIFILYWIHHVIKKMFIEFTFRRGFSRKLASFCWWQDELILQNLLKNENELLLLSLHQKFPRIVNPGIVCNNLSQLNKVKSNIEQKPKVSDTYLKETEFCSTLIRLLEGCFFLWEEGGSNWPPVHISRTTNLISI